jgi:hypothetical protein
VILSKLEKDRTELQVTIATLQKMTISISDQLVDQSNYLSGIHAILSEVAKCGPKIQKISLGVQRLEIKSRDKTQASSLGLEMMLLRN